MGTRSLPGSNAKLKVSFDAVTYSHVSEVVDLTGPEDTADEINADHRDEPVFHSYHPGRVGSTITFRCNYVPDDSGQQIVTEAIRTRRKLHFKILDDEEVNANIIVGVAIVNRRSRPAPDAGVQSLDFTLRIDGAPTFRKVQPGDLVS